MREVNEARKRGIDWKVLLESKSLKLGGLFGLDRSQNQDNNNTGNSNSNQEEESSFGVGANSNFTAGNFFGEVTALFRFFENENLGEVIASPNVVVRDGRLGRIQVGSDISIKQKDFAGNVIENFFSTGSIINVTPYVINEEGIDYILLKVAVERSSYIPDPTTTIINKTNHVQALPQDWPKWMPNSARFDPRVFVRGHPSSTILCRPRSGHKVQSLTIASKLPNRFGLDFLRKMQLPIFVLHDILLFQIFDSLNR